MEYGKGELNRKPGGTNSMLGDWLTSDTAQKIFDVFPVLSISKAGTVRRTVWTRLGEQLIFSSIVAVGAVWLTQHDQTRDMENLRKNYEEMNARLKRIEDTLAQKTDPPIVIIDGKRMK